MNTTIEKIVDLLFEELVETGETRAIHDEILQNCQERYQDLREAGISEDEAIHAVIESLSGMEEMLKDYPRKESAPVSEEPVQTKEEEEEATDEQPRTWTCDPALSPIREICMEHMGSTDVTVETSPDQLIHVEVECDKQDLTLMTGLENGMLTIALSEQKPKEVEAEIKFSLQDGFDLSSLGKLFENLAKKLTSCMRDARIVLSVPDGIRPLLKIGTASGSVTVETVELEGLTVVTASGDVELDGVQISSELRVTSAAGDITVDDTEAQQIQLTSTSGDIEADDCVSHENVRLKTTSGDISWGEQCKSLNAASISGDITLDGAMETVSFRTVSGDAELNLAGTALLSINGSTTSGDVTVNLPEGAQADISCTAVSGDICNHAGSIPGAPVAVKVVTVSGDVEIN